MKKRKQSRSKKKSNNEKVDKDAQESWYLSKLLSYEELASEHKVICNSEHCTLQAWLVYVGNKSSKEWSTCIDCMLRDYNDWPTEKNCKEVKLSLPIEVNQEIYIREKCTIDKGLTIPKYISKNTVLHEFIKNSIKQNAEPIDDIPALIHPTMNKDETQKETVNSSISDISSDITSINTTLKESIIEIKATDLSSINSKQTSNSSRSKTPVKRCFSPYFKALEKEGLVKLNPEIHNTKTKEMHKEGYYVVCIPCEKYRSKSDGVVNLRRQYYDYYFKDQHCKSESHKVAMNLLKDNNQTKSNEKVKSYSQSMLHNYFSPKPKRVEASNEIVEHTPPTESIECSTDIASTSQLSNGR